MPPIAIVKRSGDQIPFDRNRIANAINRAQRAVGCDDVVLADELSTVVVEHLDHVVDSDRPDVEAVQDAVIHVLQESGNYDVALAYARYRDNRERRRRERASLGDGHSRPNLAVIGRDGRRRPWEAEILERFLRQRLDLPTGVSHDIRQEVERCLAETTLTEIDSHLLLSLIDAALVRHGLAQQANDRSTLRTDRDYIEDLLFEEGSGARVLEKAGRSLVRSWSLATSLPAEVQRLYMTGRLWVDGLDDPLRGSHFTAALEGRRDIWEIISRAFTMVTQYRHDWRRLSLILPPSILGSLEREAAEDINLIPTLESLAEHADLYLYCDGRTPLLDNWPFRRKSISLATYAQDFLVLRQLQELGLTHLSGPTLMQGGYRRRVAVSIALNAQGLDEQFSQLDLLAMGVVAAARVRLERLARPALAGASVRYAVYGLPPGSASTEYFERQVVQEGLRCGIALARTSSLPEEACEHLGRLFESES